MCFCIKLRVRTYQSPTHKVNEDGWLGLYEELNNDLCLIFYTTKKFRHVVRVISLQNLSFPKKL
jgi:hypothetical protein